MKFGYFTLSDNHYATGDRDPNAFISDICDEAIYAEELGMHSAWIGEHHFSTLGVLSCPDIVLAYVARATEKLRLAPAVTVLPLHHPIRVAEQWATLDLLSNGRVDFACGRGYDQREYGPFKAPFEDNRTAFEEGLEAVLRLWSEDEPVTHNGKYWQFDDISLTPKPVQRPIPTYVAAFSKPSIELAARMGLNLVVAPFGVTLAFGGLQQGADVFRDACVAEGNEPGRMICSYFTHYADTPEEDRAARERQVRYFKECVIAAVPGDPKTAPPTYKYFADMVTYLENMKPEDLTENSVLLGKSDRMIETLKKAEEAGFEEVILYFNVGLKPHNQVKEEMARFMEEVAPAFDNLTIAAQ